MKYAVVFEKSETGWGAYLPDLPGCVAVDSTFEGCKKLIGEAVNLHLATMRADGDDIPEPTTVVDFVQVA